MKDVITEDRIWSPNHCHFAERVGPGPTGWKVSYMGDDRFTRSQAITAMTLAGAYTATCEDQISSSAMEPFMTNWAAELGVDLDDAIERMAQMAYLARYEDGTRKTDQD